MTSHDTVTITTDPGDGLAARQPVRWAVDELRRSLERRAAAVQVREEVGETKRLGTEVVVASASSPAAREMLGLSGVVMPQAAEALALVPSCVAGRQAVLACGADTGGLVYAVLELKDRVEHADSVSAALRFSAPVVERPANAIRSVARLFTSEVEDKPWLHDREFWRQYLSMLVAQRFNRISLTLGIGYDFPRRIDDAYLYFAYPFLVSTPGYDVHVRGLPQAERDMNLSMLEFVSNEAAGRGLHCQLGLWTHSYEWTESPRANYFVEGLTPDRHAAYCRDSLRALLEACPQIAGVTFRVHGESGIREGSYKFWETVFDGVAQCGRRVEIDMHAKGIDQRMIDIALATGLPVNVSPKYWAEHMGLPYQQASIRELERPPRDVHSESYMTLSAGSRQFTRYGYADLLREDRRYGVLFRLWPGTQRLLLWGDPVMAAGYGRASNFCGCQGVEFCEPLSFKGRKGSGRPDSRDGYANPSLRTEYGWKKYLYTYRLWGRLTYDPDAEADSWRRFLRTQYGPAAADAEGALANASRILPLVTTAHLPSAANNSYWPEMYTDMPVVDEARPHPYYDTPSPKRFGAVSALDPVLFASVDEFAAELATGQRSGKVSPLDVAGWLEQMAEAAGAHLARIGEVADSSWGPDLRRLMADVAIQCGLGRFFGGKLRAGVSYALYARTNDRAALHRATELYWAARDAWAELAARASVYCDDLTVGLAAHLRGHWRDRLPAIDLHIADMEQVLEQAGAAAPLATRPDSCAPDQPPPRPTCHHVPASSFRPGQPILVGLEVLIQDPSLGPTSVRLHYRHVNQAEAYVSAEMEAGPRCFRAVIPGAYSDSPYPLQYFFELRSGPGSAWLYPGLDPGTFCQPYFVVRQERHAPAMHVPGPIPKRPAS